MRIRQRLTLQFLLWVSGTVLLAFVAIYGITYFAVRDAFFDRLSSKALTTAELLLKVEEVTPKILRLVEKSNRDVLYMENILIFENDTLIYASNDSVRLKVSPSLLAEVRRNGEKRLNQGRHAIVGVVYADSNSNAVVLAGAVDRFGQLTLRNLKRTLVALFAVLVGVVGGIGWLYAGKALKPIAAINDEINAILPQHLEQRISVPNPDDELGQLSQTINALLARIEEAFRIQKNFIANVSHELKNPLTAISMQLEVSLLKHRPPDEYRLTIGSVLEDIRELSQLSVGLLQLARLNSNNTEIGRTIVRIDELLWEAREHLKAMHDSYRIRVELTGLPDNERDLCVDGNAALLKVAFVNLMENACKFSKDQSVTVRLEVREAWLQVLFCDNGIGIAEADIPRIFQPFYRASPTADVKGYGIGLSLVEQIVKTHRGSIAVTSDPAKGGTTIAVVFPSANPA